MVRNRHCPGGPHSARDLATAGSEPYFPLQMLALLHRVLRRIKALHHGLHGRLAWRCGSAARARYHFERVLALGGCNFSAYVHLGRIALGEGDYAGYRRELGNARACDLQSSAWWLRHMSPRALAIRLHRASLSQARTAQPRSGY